MANGNGVKVVTIGGGSSYTPELVEGLILRHDRLPVSELVLVDVPEGEEKLETVGALARRMVEHAGVPMRVATTLDRRRALEGADFVTTQIRVGRLPARILDERIPLSHGIMGQETNGAGGMFKAFRTIPVILGFVRDIQELCPDAWMVNFSNPSGMIEEAVLTQTDFQRAIGLCNVPVNMRAGIAAIMGVGEDRLELRLQGVNHFVFATDVLVDGRSVMDEAVERYATIADDETLAMNNFAAKPYSPEFIRGIRAIPCPYHDYYFHTAEQLAEELDEFRTGNVRGDLVRKIRRLQKGSFGCSVSLIWGDPVDHLVRYADSRRLSTHVAVHANGDIVVSPYLNMVVGNVKRHSLAEYWASGLNSVWSLPFIRSQCSRILCTRDMDEVSKIDGDLNQGHGTVVDLIDKK
ncbi:hypothetical protein E5335_03050 [Coriobacteriaceae bacterium]|nr:hypothetical protein E5335_03050 [Coriobacteriaceae bacterium]